MQNNLLKKLNFILFMYLIYLFIITIHFFNMKNIQRLYGYYIKNNNFVFKRAYDKIVILQKIKSTITTEQCPQLSKKKHAVYRGNSFKVILIFEIMNPSVTHQSVIDGVFASEKLVYEVGKIVTEKHFDENLELVFAHGIIYYKNIKPIYYYMVDVSTHTGKYYKWHSNGTKIQKGNYIDGKKNGKWKYWHSNGAVEKIGCYENDVKIGQWIIYPHIGPMKLRKTYEDGVLIFEEEFSNNPENSIYCERRRISNISQHVIFYFQSGEKKSEGTSTISGQQFGIWTTWNSFGVKIEETCYENGKKCGLSTNFYDSFDPKSIKIYKDDYLSGPLIKFFPDKTIAVKCFYNQNVLHGEYIENYKDGTPKFLKHYSNGILNGECTKYYENGCVKSHGYYDNGKKIGLWTKYSENGIDCIRREYLEGCDAWIERSPQKKLRSTF